MIPLLFGCAPPAGERPRPDDAQEVHSASPSPTGAPAPLPLAQGLDCGAPGAVGGPVAGDRPDALVRRFLDDWPDARCNDGTPGVFWYRPAASAAGAGRWVVLLQGGGSCETPDACAARWCGVDTPYGTTQMSSADTPAAVNGDGVFARGDAVPAGATDPFADANQVFVKYCSSDDWTGRSQGTVAAHHPRTGEAVALSVWFEGAAILDAVLGTLRAGGLPFPATGEELPDLDDAEGLVLAGGSAGGFGVVHAADRVRDALPGVAVSALFDSALPPALGGLGFEATAACRELGRCTAQDVLAARQADQDALWAPERDASCATFHGSDPEACADDAHVALHHVSTPAFARMGLLDGVLSDLYVEGGVTADGAPIDLPAFSRLVRDQLLTFTAGVDREEPASTVPGAFAPACAAHDTLGSSPDTFRTSVDPGTGPVVMPAAFDAWRAGAPTALVSARPADSVCP